jgi:hypothetical protein
MAEARSGMLDLYQDIMLKREYVASDHKHKRIRSGKKEDRKSVSEKSAFELELDISKIQELQTMGTRPLLRNSLALIIAQLETVLNKIPCRQKSHSTEERKWSDIVAVGNPHLEINQLLQYRSGDILKIFISLQRKLRDGNK